MNSITRCLAVSVGVLASLLVGCQSQPGPPGVAADEITIYPRVTAVDGLNTFLRVRESGVVVSRDDVMSVTIPVRSVSRETEFIQYRFFFYDATGRPHDAEPSWSRTRIEPGAQAYLEGRSVRESDDFSLEIRAAR
jgi:uncharacterized protein YcfL